MTIVISRHEFYKSLLRAFDEEETRTLCSMVLNIHYDDLPGEGLAAKQRELIAYFERRDQNGELISAVTTQRPKVIKFATGRLGPILGVDNTIPDPAEDETTFFTEIGRRTMTVELQHKITALALLTLVIIELLKLIL